MLVCWQNVRIGSARCLGGNGHRRKPMIEQTVTVTVMLFVLGLAFYSGMVAQRVKALEDWRLEIRLEFHALRTELLAGQAELKMLFKERES